MNEEFPTTPPRSDGLATTSLVLGLLSLFCVGPLTGVPAIICGHLAGRRIAQSQGRLAGSGLALAGFILGCLGTLIWIAGGIAVYKKLSGAIGKAGKVVHQVSETAWVMDVESRVREYRRDLGAWPTKQSVGAEELDSASVFKAFEVQGKMDRPIPTERVKNGRLIDRWGHPLHIAADLNENGNVAIGTGEVEDVRVLVWSDGPDGKNDYGEGDDIRSW